MYDTHNGMFPTGAMTDEDFEIAMGRRSPVRDNDIRQQRERLEAELRELERKERLGLR